MERRDAELSFGGDGSGSADRGVPPHAAECSAECQSSAVNGSNHRRLVGKVRSVFS